jgi:hypothetical protein
VGTLQTLYKTDRLQMRETLPDAKGAVCMVEEVEVICDRRSLGQSVLVSGTHSVPMITF